MLARRLASTATASSSASSSSTLANAGRSDGKRKIVLVGAGFLGSYVARALVADPRNQVLLVSRHPDKLYNTLKPLGSQILPPHSADITSSDGALSSALEGASAVVSMVGVLVGNARKMEEVQLRGAERVAKAAKEQGVERTVMISAIGADKLGETPYWRTKGEAEEVFLAANPNATILRPSIIFGPGDSFFNRFATLAKFLPFLPVFGGGVVRFQPVYAGDVARAVEICCRDDPKVVEQVGGKIIEAGGPEVFTYRQIMELVLQYTGRRRFILSLPYFVGMIQGFLLEKLPETIFTVTRDQVRQLRSDNIVSPTPPINSLSFSALLSAFPASLASSAAPGHGGADLTSVHTILPTYLGDRPAREDGKRMHGRVGGGFDEVQELKRRTKAQ